MFVRKSYHHRPRLWPALRPETRRLRAVIPLARRDLRSELLSRPYMLGACPGGYCMMRGEHSPVEAARAGRWGEGCRYKKAFGWKVCPWAMGLRGRDEVLDPTKVRPSVSGEIPGPLELEPSFPELSNKFLEKTRWQKVWASRFFLPEGIHTKEGRAVPGALRHATRVLGNHNGRLPVVDDKLGTVLALAKGRCRHYSLLRVCQRALVLGVAPLSLGPERAQLC